VVALGLLILTAVTAVVVVMVLRGEDPVSIELDPIGTYRTDAAVVFLIGVVTVLVGIIGVAVLLAGLKRSRRRRVEMRNLKERARRAEDTGADGQRSRPPAERPQTSNGDDHFDSTPRDH
jgi:hypothetical protein